MIPHTIILTILSKKIQCNKTMQLIRKSLHAGYIDSETKQLINTNKGTPQGSILSPLLSNIVLNELDQYIEKIRVEFEKGEKRARNKIYDNLTAKIYYHQKYNPGSSEIKRLAKIRRGIPSTMIDDPNFKRMMYLRYADDFIILIGGSSNDAHLIKNRVSDVLEKKCGLKLNKDKTLIINTKDGFNFLGAYCIKPHSLKAGLFKTAARNSGKYKMRMRIMIPIKDLIRKLKNNKFIKTNNKGFPFSTARKDLINFEHHEIISFYNHRISGLFNFYKFASNLNSLRKIFMFLQFSCALTLALKYKLRTKRKVFKRFGYYLKDTETGMLLKIPVSLKVTHNFSKTNLSRADDILRISWFNKLTKSSLYKTCAICSTSINVEMHHIRQVKDVKNKIKTGNSTYQQ